MKVIWDSEEELIMREIMERANEENAKEWKPQTVSTFLTRLIEKGFVSPHRQGRAAYYKPLITKNDYWRAVMLEDARYFTQGDLGAMVCQLCDEMLSKEDIERLQKKIDELR